MKSKAVVFISILLLLLVVAEVQAIDFEGETITITTWSSRPYDYLQEEVPGRIAEAEEKFNAVIEFEFFSKGELVDVNMSRLLAGDAGYDIWNMEHDHFWPLVTDDALLSVDEYITEDYYDNLPSLHQALARQWQFLGNNYYIGAANAATTTQMWLWYDKEIIEEENLEDPYDVWKAGEWTWDRWEEKMRAVTKDTTGDGEIDQVGFGGGAPHRDYLLPGAGPIVEERDGRIEFVWHEDPAIDILETAHGWFEEGIVDMDVEKRLFNAAIGWGEENRALEHEEGDVDYGYITYPLSPYGEEGWNPSWAQLGFALPVTSARPAELIEVLSFLYPSDEFEDHLDRVIEGMALDRNSYEALHWIYENTPVHVDFLAVITPISEVYFPALEASLFEGGAASRMAEVYPEVQARIDDLFNQ